jgi:hypothetical protein
LVPRRPKKYKGWSVFCVRFLIVFLNSPHRETPKNVIKKSRKNRFGFLDDFLVKTFRNDMFCYTSFVMLLNCRR